MPVSTLYEPFPGIRAGTWHITEPADVLLDAARPEGEDLLLYNTFTHEGRKRHWLACRALLRVMVSPRSPAVRYDDNGKPFLAGGGLHISLSHAGEYAAVAVSEIHPAGIDIEQMRPRVERVAERFLSPEELVTLPDSDRLAHLCLRWGGKEALFKLAGVPGLDFRCDIHILPIDYLCSAGGTCGALLRTDGRETTHTLHYQVVNEYMIVTAH